MRADRTPYPFHAPTRDKVTPRTYFSDTPQFNAPEKRAHIARLLLTYRRCKRSTSIRYTIKRTARGWIVTVPHCAPYFILTRSA